MASPLRLYDAYGAEAYRLARRLGGSDAIATAIVRRVFSMASGPVGPRTADALCRQVIREARRMFTRVAIYGNAQPPLDPTSLEWAVNELPDARRTAWILHVLEARSHEEIAYLLGIKASTSRAHVSRARAEVAQLYADLFEDGISVALTQTPVAPPELRVSLGGRRRRRIGRTMQAAPAVALAAGIALFLVVQGAEANRSELTLTPSNPTRGETVHVVYRHDGRFAGQDSLILRARFRTANQLELDRNVRPEAVTVLTRQGREYHGQFTLRDSVVYGAFAVEDLEAEQVDSRGERLWTLRTYDGEVPEYAAFAQHAHDVAGRNWEELYQIILEAVDAYPESAHGWTWRARLERQFFGDSLAETHLQRFKVLQRLLGNDTTSVDVVAAMRLYALSVLRDQSAAAPWEAVILRDFPSHPQAIQIRARAAQGLSALDSLWEGTEGSSWFVAQLAFMAATQQRQNDAMRVWATRFRAVYQAEGSVIAQQLADTPALRVEGIAALRQELDRLVTDQSRRLHESRATHAERAQSERRPLLVTLSNALLAEGRIFEARAYVDSAVVDGWDRMALMSAIGLYKALDDSESVFRMQARLAVDPGTPPAIRAQMQVSDAERQMAEAEMIRRTMAASINRPLPVILDSLVLPGTVTVVALWSPLGLTGHRQRLETFRPAIERFGGRLVEVKPETQASVALQVWSLPRYVVVDRSSRIRFLHGDTERLVREVFALRTEVQPPSVDR